MEEYLILKSTDSQAYFVNNKPYDFRVKLNRRLQFPGRWYVSLMELTLVDVDTKKLTSQQMNVNVLCNLCDVSEVGGQTLPILRQVNLNYAPRYEFQTFWNRPIILQETPYVRVYIFQENGEEASFLKGETRVVLLLKRYPFID